MQSNPFDVGREMLADIDMRHFKSCHCHLTVTAVNDGSRDTSRVEGCDVGCQYQHMCRGLNGLNR